MKKQNREPLKIFLARNISFCGGVSWAVQQVFRLREEAGEPITVFGELIHNRQFEEELIRRGIRTAESLEECRDQIVVIRSHGVPPETEKSLRAVARKVEDLTCPKVKKVQQLVRDYSNQGYSILITGSENHPEVAGLRGYAARSTVIETLQEADLLQIEFSAVLISQTTFSEERFEEISRKLLARYPGLRIENTICAATRIRQKEVADLAQKCDLMVIVGGKHSSNTRKLKETALKSSSAKVVLVETAKELCAKDFQGVRLVGVASGASTPHWIIDEVISVLEKF